MVKTKHDEHSSQMKNGLKVMELSHSIDTGDGGLGEGIHMDNNVSRPVSKIQVTLW